MACAPFMTQCPGRGAGLDWWCVLHICVLCVLGFIGTGPKDRIGRASSNVDVGADTLFTGPLFVLDSSAPAVTRVGSDY